MTFVTRHAPGNEKSTYLLIKIFKLYVKLGQYSLNWNLFYKYKEYFFEG